MPGRPNLAALTLSAALVAGGALAVLRWQPAIPGLGVVRSGGGLGAAVVREAPATSGPGCREERRVIHGGYRFLTGCSGQAPSFDARFYVVKNAGRNTGVGLVRGGSGQSLDDLGTLDDGRAFSIFWSPVNHRFFANQQLNPGFDRFRLFEVRGDRLVESRVLGEAAAQILLARRACLAPADIAVSGIRWGADGRRAALLVHARREACGGTGNARPLWMIGDVVTGRIERGSLRPRSGRAPLPQDGPYATL